MGSTSRRGGGGCGLVDVGHRLAQVLACGDCDLVAGLDAVVGVDVNGQLGDQTVAEPANLGSGDGVNIVDHCPERTSRGVAEADAPSCISEAKPLFMYGLTN